MCTLTSFWIFLTLDLQFDSIINELFDWAMVQTILYKIGEAGFLSHCMDKVKIDFKTEKGLIEVIDNDKDIEKYRPVLC